MWVDSEVNISILTINVGSSSIKFALYELSGVLERRLAAKIDRIGLSDTRLICSDAQENQSLVASDHQAAAKFLIEWLKAHASFSSIRAIGHRIVHGLKHSEPALATDGLMRELRDLSPLDPDHLPAELALVEAFQDLHLPQVLCFDTAFHRTMPEVAKLVALPRRYRDRGIERFGFHGLSYVYLVDELTRLSDSAARSGKVILAHLGSGASLAAVQSGKSIDTSMGFTPTGGVVMGTRSGDLDPGIAAYLARIADLSPREFYEIANHKAGMLGVSETSSDMRDLLAQEATDSRAKDAVALFCYQVKKCIGAYAAALGGLDTLVFAGGIGENSPLVRERVCAGLAFLGIVLDEDRNARNEPLISATNGRVNVRVIHTDEELVIAKSVIRLIGLGPGNAL